MNTRNILQIAAMVAGILLLLGGCSSKQEIVTPEGRSGYLLPGSPDKLMANFVTAYGSMDLEGYAQVLHEDFVFTFQLCDVQKLGLLEDHLTRQEELAVAANMFSRAEVTKDDGRKVPGIHFIEFLYCERVSAWEAAAGFKDRDEVLGATYDMVVEITQMTGSVITIQGRSVFYVTGAGTVDTATGGAPYYHLIGWVDLTEGCMSD